MKPFIVKYVLKNFETDDCNTIFHITFQYKTFKGNIRTQTVAIKRKNTKDAENMFWVWIDIMKNDSKKYVMKDVEIKEIKEFCRC